MIILTSDRLKAHILPRGATLAGLWLTGRARSLVLGYASAAQYRADRFYMGAVVGPIANRLAGASLEIDGSHWTLAPNEGSTLLHSGAAGLHARDWQVAEQNQSAVTLVLDLAPEVDGLPGRRRFCARYALGDDASLTLTLTATTDCATVANLAHHPYWTLDDAPDISGHRLRVPADHYLPVTQANLPTGEIAKVDGTAYDFRTERAVPVDRTLDANHCLARTRSDTPQPVATLTGSTGIRLQIDTTEPGLQLYNGSGLTETAAAMLPGQQLRPFAGIALEPQAWPDAPHHPQFPAIRIDPITPYRQVTTYRITS